MLQLEKLNESEVFVLNSAHVGNTMIVDCLFSVENSVFHVAMNIQSYHLHDKLNKMNHMANRNLVEQI